MRELMSSEPVDYGAMANKREGEAAVLSDHQIYRTMIAKFFELGMPADMIAAMIFDTVPDHDFIFKELDRLTEEGVVSSNDATEIGAIIKNRLES